MCKAIPEELKKHFILYPEIVSLFWCGHCEPFIVKIDAIVDLVQKYICNCVHATHTRALGAHLYSGRNKYTDVPFPGLWLDVIVVGDQ